MTRQQVALEQTVVTYLTNKTIAPGLSATLAARLGERLHVGVTLGTPEVRALGPRELAQVLPEAGFFALLTASPTPHRLLLDIDGALGTHAVERLLQGDAATLGGRAAREPTELELGVMSFLVLDLIDCLTGTIEHGRELALTMDRMLSKSEQVLARRQDDDCELLQVGLRVQLERKLGFARLFLPAALVTGYFGERLKSSSDGPHELDLVRRCLMAMPAIETEAQVTAAKLTLSAEDIAALEVGDIIVLEEHALELTPAGVAGTVEMRLGSGQNGAISARLFDEAGEARLEIASINIQHEPEGASMAEAESTAPDNLPETEGLLRDVDASVAVELGRLKLSTAQVVRLRRGQVLRLARNTSDPVDLVVRGKLFAKGELIEVDGELGVRLTHVTGTET